MKYLIGATMTVLGIKMFYNIAGLVKRFNTFKSICAQKGQEVVISPVNGSFFRLGDMKDHGKGRALDVQFPDRKHNLAQLYNWAQDAGFNAIGVYPDWKPHNGGMHLAYRDQNYISKWAGIKVIENGKSKQIYVAIEKGFDHDTLTT